MSDGRDRMYSAGEKRDALIRQWQRIANAIPGLDLRRASRVRDWTNREVLAHLSIQPRLVGRFLRTASTEQPSVSLASNLAGTSALAETVDQLARAASDADLAFAANVDRVLRDLLAADLTSTITSIQGPIKLSDYLATRCVEAVVHGQDFNDAVEPDAEAMGIACEALRQALVENHAALGGLADALEQGDWLDIATGRQEPPAELAGGCPVMA